MPSSAREIFKRAGRENDSNRLLRSQSRPTRSPGGGNPRSGRCPPPARPSGGGIRASIAAGSVEPVIAAVPAIRAVPAAPTVAGATAAPAVAAGAAPERRDRDPACGRRGVTLTEIAVDHAAERLFRGRLSSRACPHAARRTSHRRIAPIPEWTYQRARHSEPIGALMRPSPLAAPTTSPVGTRGFSRRTRDAAGELWDPGERAVRPARRCGGPSPWLLPDRPAPRRTRDRRSSPTGRSSVPRTPGRCAG